MKHRRRGLTSRSGAQLVDVCLLLAVSAGACSSGSSTPALSAADRKAFCDQVAAVEATSKTPFAVRSSTDVTPLAEVAAEAPRLQTTADAWAGAVAVSPDAIRASVRVVAAGIAGEAKDAATDASSMRAGALHSINILAPARQKSFDKAVRELVTFVKDQCGATLSAAGTYG